MHARINIFHRFDYFHFGYFGFLQTEDIYIDNRAVLYMYA